METILSRSIRDDYRTNFIRDQITKEHLHITIVEVKRQFTVPTLKAMGSVKISIDFVTLFVSSIIRFIKQRVSGRIIE